MPRSCKSSLLLEKINELEEDCSDFELFMREIENFPSDELRSSVSEEDKMVKKCGRGQKRNLESENSDKTKVTAADGTIWEEMGESAKLGRAPIHNVFRETSGPTGYPKRNIMKGEAFLITKRSASNNCLKKKLTAAELIKLSEKCLANNYCPLPVVITRGRGVNLYDVEGKHYLDFISGYGAISLGHSHPKICKVIFEQARLLAHTSRNVLTKNLIEYAEYITELFCYEKVLPMNSGTEACETAIKLARKWGYRCKGICSNQAKVLFAENNFWGRSIAAISASTNPENYRDYGPFVPCFDTVPFSDTEALAYKIKDPNICAFMIEPIQGEAGIIIPDPCYLKQVRQLCTENRVLMIADEIQCGLGRTGSLLCCDIYKIRPDVLILGKALSAGFMPVSAVLADSDIMDVIEPNTHGSTFGGNPLGCKIAIEALRTLQEENLIENARLMGEILRGCLCDLPKDIVCEIRGVGLLNALVLNCGINASEVCRDMMKHGLLASATKNGIIRLCPPLSINEKEIHKATKIIRRCIENSRGNCVEGGDANFKRSNPKGKEKRLKCGQEHQESNLSKKVAESLKKLCSDKASDSSS